MNELNRFRAVQVEAVCPKFPRPLSWEQHTTRTDEDLRRFAAFVFAQVCTREPGPACGEHDVTILEIPQTSTGSRRG